MLTVTELEARQLALTIRGAIILLCVLGVCAAILLALALHRYSKDQDQEHEERMASIRASLDMGQTAWAHSDVHKSQLLREQAKELAELRAWKAHTEARLAELKLQEVLKG